MTNLTQQDQDLIKIAKQEIKKLFSYKKHHLATAIRTKNGQVVTGINMAGSFGCNDICAEQITLGKALSEGLTDIETIVSVRHPKPDDKNQQLKVANPCGKCRELIIDYTPEAVVIVRDDNNKLKKVKATKLIPHRYKK